MVFDQNHLIVDKALTGRTVFVAAVLATTLTAERLNRVFVVVEINAIILPAIGIDEQVNQGRKREDTGLNQLTQVSSSMALTSREVKKAS